MITSQWKHWEVKADGLNPGTLFALQPHCLSHHLGGGHVDKIFKNQVCCPWQVKTALVLAFKYCTFSEKAMATHSSTLAWKIPWAEEPGRLQSMGSHKVRHDWSDLEAAAAALLFLFIKDKHAHIRIIWKSCNAENMAILTEPPLRCFCGKLLVVSDSLWAHGL